MLLNPPFDPRRKANVQRMTPARDNIDVVTVLTHSGYGKTRKTQVSPLRSAPVEMTTVCKPRNKDEIPRQWYLGNTTASQEHCLQCLAKITVVPALQDHCHLDRSEQLNRSRSGETCVLCGRTTFPCVLRLTSICPPATHPSKPAHASKLTTETHRAPHPPQHPPRLRRHPPHPSRPSLHLPALPPQTPPQQPTSQPPRPKTLHLPLGHFYGHKTLTGQQAAPRLGPSAELEYLQRITGKQPAILGLDYLHPAEQTFVNDYATRWYLEQGGIPTICWHWGAPDIGTGYENAKKDFDLPAALRAGTPQHDSMQRDLAGIADQLTVLRDRDIPVLWRPAPRVHRHMVLVGQARPLRLQRSLDHYVQLLHRRARP